MANGDKYGGAHGPLLLLSSDDRNFLVRNNGDQPEEHLKNLEEKLEEEAKGSPDKVKSDLRAEHELTRILGHEYVCWCREQTLESLLVAGDRDFVIEKSGHKVPVSELVGKHIMLYFSARWCPPCCAFVPKLIEAYHKIKEIDEAFEVIFISSDKDQASYDEFFSRMPWLALPFGDSRKASLSSNFEIQGIHKLVAIGPSGRTVTKEAKNHIMLHGAKAYPFTEERLKELEAELEEMAKGWPEKLKSALHKKHDLVLFRRPRGYVCDSCDEPGGAWSFYCEGCDFDLHPKCALEVDTEPSKKKIQKYGYVKGMFVKKLKKYRCDFRL